jgi:two-component system, cell cycle response regulator
MFPVPRPGPVALQGVARAWRAAAVTGFAALVAYTFLGERLGPDDIYNRWLYDALILLGLAACATRAVRVQAERGAWWSLTIGVGAWAIAEQLFHFVYSGSPPYPSVADVFYLAFYPACYVALLLLLRERFSEFSRSLWLDGAMATLATAAFGAAVLFEVVLRSTHGSTDVIVTNLAYPLGDILLLSAVIGIFALTGWRPDRTWVLIGAGLALSAFADAVFLVQTATDSYTQGTLLDVVWPASILLLSAAAWQRPHRVAVTLEGRPLLATPLVCGLIGLGIFMYDHFHPLNVLATSLAGATMLTVMLRTWITFRENTSVLAMVRHQAFTDALTGLGNRRRLVAELERALAHGTHAEPRLLAIFDLDGFKLYNDTFGHPAGDVLLARLARNLAAAVGSVGICYRLGGDEFCVLAGVSGDQAAFLNAASKALGDKGEGFTVTSSFGAVFFPEEAASPSEVLRLADQRLYTQKRQRAERGHPHEMLLRALYEREPGLQVHVQSVAEMACAVGAVLGLAGEKLEELRLAARLHDVGKLAIPDDVLQKPGPLNLSEWAFIREHTVIGERILGAAPAWRDVERPTSAGTAAAIPTGSPVTRSRSQRGSSPSATPSRR